MADEALHITNGILLIVYCSITIYVGLRIMSKYFKYRQVDLLYVGFAWFTLSSPFWPACTSFILVFIFNLAPLGPQAYFLIGNIMISPGMVAWIIAITDLLNIQKRKLIIIVSAIGNAIFVMFFLYFLIMDHSVIGELRGETDVLYRNFVSIYLMAVVITIFITGLLFARVSLRSDKPDIKLKGKLLIVAFISFTVGALLDAALPLSFITLPIFRSLEILGAITFYGGYILPKWMKKLFLKEKES